MRLDLPARLQAAVLDELVEKLQAVGAEEPLEIDGSNIERIDTAGIQLLLVLRRRPHVTFTSSEVVEAAARTLALDW